MPYKLFHARNGFYVTDVKNGKRFSKHPIPYENALKQREAIALHETKTSKKPIGTYFYK